MLRKVVAIAAFALIIPACFTADSDPPFPGSGPPPPPPGPDDVEMLRAFSGCPELPVMESAEFASRWAELSSNQGNCGGCHAGAGSGYEAIQDDTVIALDQMTTSADRMKVFFSIDGDDVIVNDHFALTGDGEAPFVEHPRYDSDNALSALLEVYSQAHDRYVTDSCDEPRF